MRVLAIVRAYNEQETVADVVEDVRRHVPQAQIVVIDDGSADDTAARAARTGARVVRLPFNLGMGGAAQTGYLMAQREGFDIAVQVDGDGQHPGCEVARVVEALQAADGVDMVVGSRFATPGGDRSTPLRRWGIRLLSRLLTRLLGQTVTDATSGLRAVGPRGIALFARRYPCDYVEVESLLLAARHGLVVREVAVTMLPRQTGRSTIGAAQTAVYGLRVALGVAVVVAGRRIQPSRA